MRGLMNLDEKTRAKIVYSNNPDENFDHLKIECRSKNKNHQHEGFGNQLLDEMKRVKTKFLGKKNSYVVFSLGFI